MQSDEDSSGNSVIEVEVENNEWWDNFQEDPSYLEVSVNSAQESEEAERHSRRQSSTRDNLLDGPPRQLIRPFVFDTNPDHSYSVWPPRKPSSEPEFFAEHLLPRDLLDAVNESEESEEVFFDSNNTESKNTMPPKAPPTPQSLFQDFGNKLEDWRQMHEEAVEFGRVSKGMMDDLTKCCKSVESLCRNIQNLEPNHINLFPDLAANKKKVKFEWNKLLIEFEEREARAASVPPQQCVSDSDEDTEKLVSETKKNISILTSKAYSVEEEMLKLFTDSPEPSSHDAEDMTALLTKIREYKENIHTFSIKLTLETAKFFDKTKAKELSDAAENEWKTLKAKIDCLQRKGKEYLSKTFPSAPLLNQPSRPGTAPKSIPLERLPLPTFKGNKMDYLRFKQDFQNHVKYESDGEKVLALKTKCLTKNADKQVVANMMSMQECWEKLDEEYGNIDTLVSELFSSWASLKNPTNDFQFVKFVANIEAGASLLKSLGHEKELDTSYSAIMLEQKLPVRLQQEYTKSLATQKGCLIDRMQFLLKFLKEEKRACQLRTSNYCGNTKKTDDDNCVASSFGGVGVTDRGRGRGGRGAGKGRGGKDCQDKNVQNGGRGKGRGEGGRGKPTRRGEPSTSCVVCEGDHASSKCVTWRDKKSIKADLFYFACETIPRLSKQPFCLLCLEPGHYKNRCPSTEDYGCPCKSGISKYLCSNTDDCKTRKNWSQTSSSTSTTNTASSLTVVNGVCMGNALLPIQSIPLSNSKVQLRVMFDNCSQSTFIKTKVAKKLKLKGVLVNYILICTDGSEKEMQGLIYKLSLRDMSGEHHELEAIGIEKLSTHYAGAKVSRTFLPVNP